MATGVIVTGIPHSGTSMLTEYLEQKTLLPLPATPLESKPTDPHADYNTYESERLKNGFDWDAFKAEFPGGYLWKTVYLPHELHEIREKLDPVKVYISIRDPLYHGNSIARRYNRQKANVADELRDTYPYLVRVACWMPTVVVQAEELADHLGTNRLTRDETPNWDLEQLREDRNYHTLVELSRRREWLTANIESK